MNKFIERAKTPTILVLLGIIAVGQASVFQQARVAQEYRMNWLTAQEKLVQVAESRDSAQQAFEQMKLIARDAMNTATKAVATTKAASDGWTNCRIEASK